MPASPDENVNTEIQISKTFITYVASEPNIPGKDSTIDSTIDIGYKINEPEVVEKASGDSFSNEQYY